MGGRMGGGRPLPGPKKSLGRWKLPIPGSEFQNRLRICETSLRNPGSSPSGTRIFRAAAPQLSLDFRGHFRGPVFAQRSRP